MSKNAIIPIVLNSLNIMIKYDYWLFFHTFIKKKNGKYYFKFKIMFYIKITKINKWNIQYIKVLKMGCVTKNCLLTKTCWIITC